MLYVDGICYGASGMVKLAFFRDAALAKSRLRSRLIVDETV